MMLPMRSMTGFGRAEEVREGLRMAVELRAVNRRQLEISLRLPPELEALEGRIRTEIARNVSRGRVDARVLAELPPEWTGARVNAPVAAAYARELGSLAARLGLPNTLTLETLVRCPGVLQADATAADPEALWAVLEPAMGRALESLNKMREREGTALAADLAARISAMRAAVDRIRIQAPGVLQRHRDQLLQRVRLAGVEGVHGDDERVLREVVLFADRTDLNEELTRLESHCAQFDHALESPEPQGRRLDFLAQEMNREVNTIGSKANDAAIASEVVHLKTELERFREQAQNVE